MEFKILIILYNYKSNFCAKFHIKILLFIDKNIKKILKEHKISQKYTSKLQKG